MSEDGERDEGEEVLSESSEEESDQTEITTPRRRRVMSELSEYSDNEFSGLFLFRCVIGIKT